MKIVYTLHAAGKFKSLQIIGWKFKISDIKSVITHPDYFLEDKIRGVKIALKKINDKHNLRVIYNDHGGIITVVTFYPAEKGRYEQKNS